MKLSLMLVIAVALMACRPSPPTEKPETTALAFFQAIYIEHDVAAATQLVDPAIAELLQHYRLASQIQRNLLGLNLTEVNVGIAEVDIDFFRRQTDEVNVLIKLTGYRNGQFIMDDRRVQLTRLNDRWLITELYADPFNSNG
ncbi:hypothetical protein [Ferrimonas pelagia]|uniref:DUF4878 domain-containing protein n=1 Tax=Ferrimonas pelagia TaxID=1177826 RepID=A0ABP9FI98_9GAMM